MKILNPRNGRALHGVRIDQEPSAFPDRCRSMGAKDLGAATVIETDTLLVKCPHCGGWPMAACVPKPNSAQREIRFRCAQCRHQEGGRLRRAGSGQRLSGNPAHSAAHREMR
jgi:Zn finger protein HypA/HybF involved in hydrogenase expression